MVHTMAIEQGLATVPDTTGEQRDLQDRIIKGMKDFEAENPLITEALAVMNITMADYLQAMESLRGDQIVSASVYVAHAPRVDI